MKAWRSYGARLWLNGLSRGKTGAGLTAAPLPAGAFR